MYTQGVPFIQDPREYRMQVMLLASLLLHAVSICIFLIYPLFFKSDPIKIPILTMVQIEKPKVTLRKQKTIEPKTKEKPTEKKDAPKITNKPKTVTPPKEVPREVKKDPDTTEVKQVVQQPVKDMKPRMVMEDMTDPRLAMWIRMVSKIIQTHWHPPRGIGILGQAEVTIEFTVVRPGQIKNTGVGKTSGNGDLDNFALNTVERIGKLPPIPPNFREKNELDVQFVFHYTGD